MVMGHIYSSEIVRLTRYSELRFGHLVDVHLQAGTARMKTGKKGMRSTVFLVPLVMFSFLF